MLKRFRLPLAVLAAVPLVWGAANVVACTEAEEDTASTGQQLIRFDAASLFAPDASVPVCWMKLTKPGYNKEKEWSRLAIENSWMKVTNVRFTGWKDCPDPADAGDAGMIKLVIADGTTPDSGPKFCGNTKTEGTPNLVPANRPEVDDAGVWQNTIYVCYSEAGTGPRDAVNYEMVHEFGHVLGYRHEQDQDAAASDPEALVDPGGCGKYVFDGGVSPGDKLTTYDPDSVMNYCATDRGTMGRVSDLDIQGIQQDYGTPTRVNANGEVDSDGDNIPDWRDNCPYVANPAQTDSNKLAELTVQQQLGQDTGKDGGPPTDAGDATYIAHWHAAYKGDACDPVVSTYTTNTEIKSHVENADHCWDQEIGGSSARQLTDASCPVQINTGLGMNSYFGGPSGLSPDRSGTSVPTFCACQYANDPSQSYRCNTSLYQCYVAQDTTSPYDPFPDDSKWTKISQEHLVDPNDPDAGWSTQDFPVTGTTHVDVMPWLQNSPTVSSNWDMLADLPTFGFNDPHDAGPGADAGANDMAGMVWTQVRSFPYPIVDLPNPDGGTVCQSWDGGPSDCTTNLEDTYTPLDAHWDYGSNYTYIPYFAYHWRPVPYCDPNPADQVEWNAIPYMTVDTASGTTAVVGQNASGVVDLTSHFTGGGLSVAALLGGGDELLMADDRIGGQAPGDTGPNALVVSPSSAQLLGAFTIDQGKIDGVTLSTPATSTTTLRTYAAGPGKLYYLANPTGSYTLHALDVTAALGGTNTDTSTGIAGVAPSAPAAVAFNRVTQAIDVLDWVQSGSSAYERLLQLSSSGVSTELWHTASFSVTVGQPSPTLYLSTTLDGDIIVSQTAGSATAGYTTDVLWCNGAGRPLGSYSESGALHTSAVGTAASLTLPMEQTPSSTTPNVRLDSQPRSAMGYGVCNSPWWTKIANHVAGSGALADGATCNPIGNGEFEVGSLMHWTASGELEDISTTAHSGSYSAILGSASPTSGDSTIQQTFTVPAGGGTLSFWYSNVCPDTVYYDWFTATLQTPGGSTLATIVPKTCAASSAWTQATLDLAPYAGQTVVVVLTSHDDGYYYDPTYTLVDDVSVH